MLSRSLVSGYVSHHVHMLSLNEIKKFQNKENRLLVIVNGKKIIEINDVIAIKKKGLYKSVIPMSLLLYQLEKFHTPFGHPDIHEKD